MHEAENYQMKDKPNILVVDDTSESLELLVRVLTEAGYQARPADSGELAMAAVAANLPDLILLDIRMKGISGLEVCQRLKAREETRRIPIILISAFAEVKEWVEGLQRGAVDYICKPFQIEELLARVKTHLSLRQAGVSLEQQAAVLLQKNEQLQSEILERQCVEEELRQSLEQTELSRQTALSALEDQKRAEEALRASNELFSLFMRHSPIYAYIKEVTPSRSLVLQATDNFQQMIGIPGCETIGKTMEELFPPEFAAKITEDDWAVVSKGTVLRLEEELNGRSYTTIKFPIASGNKNLLAGYTIDITEQKLAEQNLRQIEARLHQSEKMETVGQLAGGIAHDFNNVLAGIIGYTEMSLQSLEKGSVPAENLHQILQAADRAKHLVRQILTFSRQGNQQKSVTTLHPILQEVLDLLRASIPSSVRIVPDLRADSKPVLADPTKIHEVLINLATNAVHAMDRKGTLTIRHYTQTLNQAAWGQIGEIAPGEYTVMEVADTGCGMDAGVLSKAFEPFFTTKALGEGTGMGLSVVLGVVQSHGGDVQVESAPGKGSIFRIYLPIAETSMVDVAQPNVRVQSSGTERILFVDDEEMLVKTARSHLARLGYTVNGTTSSLGALKILQEMGAADIDILITDQTMPDMSGMELAKEARKIRKDLPIILCTGYSSGVSTERVAAIGISKLVMKPYGSQEISQSVREVLDYWRKE